MRISSLDLSFTLLVFLNDIVELQSALLYFFLMPTKSSPQWYFLIFLFLFWDSNIITSCLFSHFKPFHIPPSLNLLNLWRWNFFLFPLHSSCSWFSVFCNRMFCLFYWFNLSLYNPGEVGLLEKVFPCLHSEPQDNTYVQVGRTIDRNWQFRALLHLPIVLVLNWVYNWCHWLKKISSHGFPLKWCFIYYFPIHVVNI